MIKKSQGYRGQIDTTVCIYCKEPVNEASRTADHMIPESRGGIRSNDNKAPSCSRCNRIKDDMTVEEFKEFMERVISLEYHYTKIKTEYFKKVAMSCKAIIQQSTPREITINNGETKNS
jgi:5-methylcytosine-specific restriction endonuclease McrA